MAMVMSAMVDLLRYMVGGGSPCGKEWQWVYGRGGDRCLRMEVVMGAAMQGTEGGQCVTAMVEKG